MEHHPHDEKWLKQQLGKLRPANRRIAAEGYDKVYRSHLPNESIARRKANTRLREYIKKINKC